MGDLEFLQARIPEYAGYATEEARHQVDKQVRAVLGEALAAARESLAPSGTLLERLERLLVRCEFMDYHVVHVVEHVCLAPSLFEPMHAADRRIGEAADRVRTVTTHEELSQALDEEARALDARSSAIVQLVPR